MTSAEWMLKTRRTLDRWWRTAHLRFQRLAPEGWTRRRLLAGTRDAISIRCPGNDRLIYVDPRDERGQQLQRSNGDFNPPSLAIWKKLMSEGSWTHIVDIGANYGEMLVNVSLPPDAIVIAVEPNPELLPYLQRSLSEAGIHADVIRCAVADRPGHATLLIDHKWSGTTRLAHSGEAATEDFIEPITVPTTTLTALLKNAGAPHIRALIKIDVEGFEAKVLQGAVEAFADIDLFLALIEILHVPEADMQWILDRFDMRLYDLQQRTLVSVVPSSLEQLSLMRTSGTYYIQDAVIGRKSAPAP